MTTFLMLLLPLAALILLAAPLVPVYRGVTTGKKAKRSVLANLCASVSYTHLRAHET